MSFFSISFFCRLPDWNCFTDWEVRGARGLDIDLPSLTALSFSLSSPGSDSWSILDWSRFVYAWKREERIERDAKLETAAKNAAAAPSSTATPPTRQSLQPPPSQDRPSVNNDAVVKASTDKLSAVFDWLIDQIPASAKSVTSSATLPTSMNAPVKAPEEVMDAANEMVQELTKKTEARAREQEEVKPKERKNELESKEDLERFYVALSRKMYDEGL